MTGEETLQAITLVMNAAQIVALAYIAAKFARNGGPPKA